MTDLTTVHHAIDCGPVYSPAPSALPDGSDLARSRHTDFFAIGDHLDDRESLLLERVRQYCDTQVAPVANDYWERAEFPYPLVAGYRALGVAGGTLPGYGCPGLSPVAEGLVAAELARGDGSIATLNAVHSGLAMTTVGLLGSEEQKARWLPAMAAVEKLGAFALTEPDHGSDVVRLATRAHRESDGSWALHGRKRWIGNGTVADLVIVWARDDDGHVGAFVVEHADGADRPVPGYRAQRIIGKAANRAVWQANHVARHHADIEAVYTYEGTDSIQSLIVGRAITGISAFV